MYRHLSPKVGSKEKQQELMKLKHTITGTTPVIFPQAAIRKEANDKQPIKKQKQAKKLDSLLNNKPANVNFSANNINSNKRIQINKSNSKKGSVFDDYAQNKPKPQTKDKKEEISLSGDSYQSEGFNSLKMKNHSPNTFANQPTKNIVATMISQENRGVFKSPGNRPQNKAQSEEDKFGKRILSFGGKKLMAGRFLQDGDAYAKKVGQAIFTPQANQPNKNAKFNGLDVSDQKNNKDTNKQNTSNELKPKDTKSIKNVPKFISNAKSTPNLPKKLGLDSSNEISGERGIKKIDKLKELLSQKQKGKEQQQKSLSFNRGEMFLHLKKRQQQHTLLFKQLNTLGVVIQLNLIGSQGDKAVKFTLMKKICESKKTCIFLAYHQPTSFLYCLKRTPLDKSNQLLQNILQHKIHQYCSHPHLVKSFSSAYDSQNLYLIMEYMQAETLGQQLKTELLKNMSQQSAAKAKINESVTTQISKINKIRKVLFQIAGGIAYLHQKSLVHRDIKPDNVFISHDTYKVGDFGSAAKVGSLQYVGTLDYAAPEILSQSPYDQKVDIWSLGCIAYELDVGRPPFFHINPQQTKRLAINGEYDKSLISDSELRGLIQKMLQVNRKLRISGKQLLKNQFFQDLHEKNTFF